MKSLNRIQKLIIIFWALLFPIILFFTSWLRFKNAAVNIIQKPNAFLILIEFISYVLLSFTMTQLICSVWVIKKSHYRITFLSTIGIGFVFLAVSAFNQILPQAIIHLPLVAMGGFIGSFIASNLSTGFRENNHPPTPIIEKEVKAAHEAYMGSIAKTPILKRFLDILFAMISIIISIPIWALVIFLIWWEEPGPVLFVKNSVGRGGVNYKQLKFRSMVTNAEKETGPISGYENDERVLFFGKFLRKTALDELPQLINILVGDMSYVGPRPQRTVLVHGYLQSMPEYAARHRVRPGLAGLAQVADSYGISPEEKLAWDLVYIDQANIWFDLKLILAAFFLVFALRWRANSDPELTIRRLLKIKKPHIKT